MKVTEKIKILRKAKGLTQKQLAERCGLATGTMQQYELGYRNPKIDTIKKIASALNVKASDILDIDAESVDKLIEANTVVAERIEKLKQEQEVAISKADYSAAHDSQILIAELITVLKLLE